MSVKNWLTALSLFLIIDSAIFVFKLIIPIWLIVDGIRERIIFGRREEHSAADGITELYIAFRFIGGVGLLIIILLRWLVNFNQYRIPNDSAFQNGLKPICGCCSCGSSYCCCFFWFVLAAANIGLISFLIYLDLYTMWLRNFVIGCLSWECVMFVFMIMYTYVYYAKISAVFSEQNAKNTESKYM